MQSQAAQADVPFWFSPVFCTDQRLLYYQDSTSTVQKKNVFKLQLFGMQIDKDLAVGAPSFRDLFSFPVMNELLERVGGVLAV